MKSVNSCNSESLRPVWQEAVETPADVTAAFEAARESGRNSVLLLVRRDGEPRFVGLALDE